MRALTDMMPGPDVLIRDGRLFFYVSRRLWVKMTGDCTYLAGMANRLVDLRCGMAKLRAEASSLDAVQEEEQDGSS